MILDITSKVTKHKYDGKGYGGTVYLAKPGPLLSSSMPPLMILKSAAAKHSSRLQLEKIILHDLKGCPQIVQSFGDGFSVENGKLVYNLLLEYADGGTLVDLMKKSGDRIQEREASKYTCMLLKGLGHMHQKGYVYGDLKLDNILVFVSKKRDGTLEYSVKLADFGSANINGGNKNSNRIEGLETMLRVGLQDAAVDIRSVGCIVAQMLVGRHKWWNNLRQLVIDLIRSKANPQEWVETLPDDQFGSDYAKDFIRRCMVGSQQRGWTGDELLQHPFITQYGLEDFNFARLQ